MMNDDDEINLEDIENELYSQVFHSNISESEEVDILKGAPEQMENMRPPNRYFQRGINKSNKQFNRNFKRPNNVISSGGLNQISGSNYMKPAENQRCINLNDVLVVSPYNNIKKKRNERKKRNEKKKRRQLLKKQAKAAVNKNANEQNVRLTSSNSLIIISSDSEDSTTLPAVPPSDGNLQNEGANLSFCSSGGDDVIYIEPPPIEVISLDDDPETSTAECIYEQSQQNTSNSLNSGPSSISINANESAPMKPTQECSTKDLPEETPESTNDFMENAGVELALNNFNFSLHGSDFNNKEFLKPAPVDTCETETSSSTTDVNMGLKQSVFNEIEFPKEDLFGDSNLENFGNLITPVREQNVATIVRCSTPKESNVKRNIYGSSSESSSESDFGESKTDHVRNKKLKQLKKLPNLSPMQTDTNNTTQTKSKKSINQKPEGLDNSPTVLEKSKRRKSSQNSESRKNLSKSKRRKSGSFVEDNEIEHVNTENRLLENKEGQIADLDKRSSICETNQDFNIQQNIIQGNNETNESEIRNLENRNICVTNIVEVSSDLDGIEIIDVTAPDESKLVKDVTNETREKRNSMFLNISSTSRQQRNNASGSVNLENYTVNDILQKMSDDPALWRISDKDRNHIRRASLGKRCNRCRDFGHAAIRCPRRKGPLRCKLCGFEGHVDYRCPNSMCVQCGHPGNSQTYCQKCFRFRNQYCNICGMIGHIHNSCPDLWRRYHLTTQSGPLIADYGPPLKPRHLLWCSSCAQPGHLEHTCNFAYSPYPKYDPKIQHYVDVYNDVQDNIQPQIINGLYGSNQSNQPDLRSIINNRRANDTLVTPDTTSNMQPNINWVAPMQDNFPYANLTRFDDDRVIFTPVPNANWFASSGFSFNQQTNAPSNVRTLPEFIPLDTNPVNDMPHEEYKQYIRKTNNYNIFFKVNGRVGSFLKSELDKLHKLQMDKESVLRQLKRSYEENSHTRAGLYYRTLNMMLFGIYHFKYGQFHLDKLRHFRRILMKDPTGSLKFKRHLVYKSYCYIFGTEKNNNIDYRELLYKI